MNQLFHLEFGSVISFSFSTWAGTVHGELCPIVVPSKRWPTVHHYSLDSGLGKNVTWSLNYRRNYEIYLFTAVCYFKMFIINLPYKLLLFSN